MSAAIAPTAYVQNFRGDFAVKVRQLGCAGLVFTEATHVSAKARITPGCLGLWNDEHAAFLKRLVGLIDYAGGVAGIQVAHAGRKASRNHNPWSLAGKADGQYLAACGE